jgi:hypothetical protein
MPQEKDMVHFPTKKERKNLRGKKDETAQRNDKSIWG